ncbi:MAG: zf-HC2 domain-containing protein [Gemmataceae bacterium]
MVDNMHDEQSPGAPWSPCPPGELGRLGWRLHNRRRRRQFLRATAGVAGAALTAGVFWFFRDQLGGVGGEPTYAGLTCSEVRQLAPAMMMKKLPAEKVQQIEEHVALCTNCQQLFKKMKMMPKEMG